MVRIGDENKHENRRAALLSLLKQHKSIERLATLTETAPGHLSQMKNRSRRMGEAVARRIERRLNLQPECMDAGRIVSLGDTSVAPVATTDQRLLADLADLLPEDEERFRAQIHAEAERVRKITEHARSRGNLGTRPPLADAEVAKHIAPAPKFGPTARPTKATAPKGGKPTVKK